MIDGNLTYNQRLQQRNQSQTFKYTTQSQINQNRILQNSKFTFLSCIQSSHGKCVSNFERNH